MNKKIIFLSLIIISLSFIKTSSFALTKNKIIVRVNDQIISSYELKNKIKTMLFLSNQNMTQKNIDLTKKQALNQLIDLKLKKNQLAKLGNTIKSEKKINNYLKNLSLEYKTNIDGIKKIFINNGLDFEIHIEEIRTDFSWQQLIFNRYRDQVTLDENQVSNELNKLVQKQNNLLEYELAEIEIALKNNTEDKITINQINQEIKEFGFENTAKKYSISNSSLDGGNIGWINAKTLSKSILLMLNNMKTGDVSKPIIQSNSATILKILDKKNLDINSVDINRLRQKVINSKKNELLNLYSNNFLSKLRNSALIEIK